MKRLLALACFCISLDAQVTYERLLTAAAEPSSWLTYSGDYSGHRYSPLRQINRSSVSRLHLAWAYQTNDLNQFEATPLVADGVMYISEPPSNAAALDVKTGRPLWLFRRAVPSDVRACCGQVNRGVALFGDTVYLGTLDSHLIALDAKTGHVLWDTVVADYQKGYSITVAPLAIKDKVIVGVAGGEYGVRGFLDAYDAKSGKQAWRFWTVPAPGEKGNDSWSGDSWKTGSATTWTTGSYDPLTNVIYWGTGNPGPDYNGAVRKGDNLYSDSVVALDANTGALKWHFQFTPHDTHDWDSTHTPVLLDGSFRGVPHKMLTVADRNGFFYLLDRETGKFLMGKPFGKVNWAKGLDEKGRPMVVPGSDPVPEGRPTYPGVHGATNWMSPSYSPDTLLEYIPTREEGTNYYLATAEYKEGNVYFGGGNKGIRGIEPSGSIKALDPYSGNQVWEFPLHSPPWAGVLSTGGGLVFGGTVEGNIFALDASTGKSLWNFQAGGMAYSNPMSYQVDGKQYLAFAVGHALMVFTLD